MIVFNKVEASSRQETKRSVRIEQDRKIEKDTNNFRHIFSFKAVPIFGYTIVFLTQKLTFNCFGMTSNTT